MGSVQQRNENRSSAHTAQEPRAPAVAGSPRLPARTRAGTDLRRARSPSGTGGQRSAASVLPGHSAALRDASRLALGVGIIGSLGAAATGATDWQHTHEESRRIGIVRGLLNTAATTLYAV